MEEKNFEKMKVPELKEALGKLNLPTSGTKEILVKRLQEASSKNVGDDGSDSESQELPEDISKMKVNELKDALRKRSLSSTGTKAELVKRLSGSISGSEIETNEEKPGKRKAESSSSKSGGALKKRKVSKNSEDSDESPDESSEEEEKGEKEREKTKKKTPKSKQESSGKDDFSQPVLDIDEIRICTWNVAGFKAIMGKGFTTFLKNENPDIICLNETKIKEDGHHFPGYHAYFYACEGNVGYSGVGLLTKIKPISIQKGIGDKEHDTEGRCITAEYDNFYVVATYIPNAGAKDKDKSKGGMPKDLDYRMAWDTAFQGYLHELDKKKPIIWCGDLNVAHKEIDLANPKINTKTAGFTKQERESFGKFLNTGFVDVHRHFYPNEEKCFTFWTYRGGAREKNVGWRLDYFVVSQRLLPKITQSYIRRYVQGSDHCPIGIHIKN